MASVTSQLIEEVIAHAQTDSLEDAREICADGTYFPNNYVLYMATSSVPATGVHALPCACRRLAFLCPT